MLGTFSPGEGIGCASLVGAVIDRPRLYGRDNDRNLPGSKREKPKNFNTILIDFLLVFVYDNVAKYGIPNGYYFNYERGYLL